MFIQAPIDNRYKWENVCHNIIMDVLSFKGSLSFIIIIFCSMQLSRGSIEITKDNCKNNRTFLSECSFHIFFQPPLTEKLECSLTFPTKTNYSVRFSSDSFVLQRQIGQMCPQFFVDIKTQDEKPKRLFTTCGGTLNQVLKTFTNFTWGHILYYNNGLIDNSTTIKMQLSLETGKPCDKLNSKAFDVKDHRLWIIISSVVGCLVLIIICAVIIVYRFHFKGKERKAPNSLLLEEGIHLRESAEDGNGESKDLEDDSKRQDPLVKTDSSEG